MWNLKRLEVEDYRTHLDVAFPAGAVPEEVSEEEKTALLEIYNLYEQKLGRPSPELIGEETREGLRQLVHDAYSLVQDGRRLGSLRSALKLLADLCPYCGFGSIDELDHLLQRGQFKLFSIFPLNLVPSCGPCNRGKRKKPSTDPHEHQVHVYLEDLTGYDFLRTEVNVSADTGGLQVRYFIEQCDGMSEDVHSRLVHHLKEFDLQARYEKQVNIFLGAHEYAITSTFETGGAAGLHGYLTGTANALRKRFGTNDWRTALMRGLAECPVFYEGGFETALGLRPACMEIAV